MVPECPSSRLKQRGLQEERAAAPELSSVTIPLKQLAAGHILAADILTDDGKVLLASGRRITDVLREKLQNYAAVVRIEEPIAVRRTG